MRCTDLVLRSSSVDFNSMVMYKTVVFDDTSV